MSDLKRYDIVGMNGASWFAKEHPDGLFVQAYDALRLERERDEVRDERNALRESSKQDRLARHNALAELAKARAEIARLSAKSEPKEG